MSDWYKQGFNIFIAIISAGDIANFNDAVTAYTGGFVDGVKWIAIPDSFLVSVQEVLPTLVAEIGIVLWNPEIKGSSFTIQEV